MKHQALVMLTALSLLAGPSAFAQREDRGGQPDKRGGPGHSQAHRRNPPPRLPPPPERGRQHGPGERGAGPDHAYYRGDRLPQQYRNRQYVVDDWRGHNLSAPPRGYHWVQTGGDFVLVAIATGLILQLLLDQ